jgi:hypothetical protein
MTTTITLQSFIQDRGITMTAQQIPKRPDSTGDAWEASARHFLCTFYRGGHGTGKGPQEAAMVTYFSQGSAHTKPPTCADVLDCLASDASSVENCRGFEDWCGDLGYDSDSRKAFAIFEACTQQRDELRVFLGDSEAFAQLLFGTERL